MATDFSDILNLLQSFGTSPLTLFFAIIIATFILEDPATVAGAFIAVEGLIDPLLALCALYIGIFVGDLGLYGLGRLAQRYWRIKNILERKGMMKVSNKLGDWMIGAILTARFIPGMRLPTYTACGLFRLSFSKFAATSLIAVVFWTSALFTLSFILGEVVISHLGEWRWAIALIIVIASLFLPRLIKKLIHLNPKHKKLTDKLTSQETSPYV
ncbi:MAG: VTT domain-containing protein [Alphaproteobacteria bacterium]|nr:VTT domain-containing protein [Alphaproteobacteria bacterium]